MTRSEKAAVKGINKKVPTIPPTLPTIKNRLASECVRLNVFVKIGSKGPRKLSKKELLKRSKKPKLRIPHFIAKFSRLE